MFMKLVEPWSFWLYDPFRPENVSDTWSWPSSPVPRIVLLRDDPVGVIASRGRPGSTRGLRIVILLWPHCWISWQPGWQIKWFSGGGGQSILFSQMCQKLYINTQKREIHSSLKQTGLVQRTLRAKQKQNGIRNSCLTFSTQDNFCWSKITMFLTSD